MTKLRIAIDTQNEKYKELSDKYDYFTIKDPIFNTIHMNVISKNELHDETKMICEHFYNIEDLTELYKGNYQKIKTTLSWVLVVISILLIIFSTVLIITFSYLENKALSLIPLLSLIIITVFICFFILYLLRLNMITKIINGQHKIDRKYIFLILYKLKKENLQTTSVFGFADECAGLRDDCINPKNEDEKF